MINLKKTIRFSRLAIIKQYDRPPASTRMPMTRAEISVKGKELDQRWRSDPPPLNWSYLIVRTMKQDRYGEEEIVHQHQKPSSHCNRGRQCTNKLSGPLRGG